MKALPKKKNHQRYSPDHDNNTIERENLIIDAKIKTRRKILVFFSLLNYLFQLILLILLVSFLLVRD